MTSVGESDPRSASELEVQVGVKTTVKVSLKARVRVSTRVRVQRAQCARQSAIESKCKSVCN